MKEGWEYKKFSEIFDLQMGRTPARDKKSYWEGDNLWVSIGDMGDCKYISHTKESISDIAIKEAKMPIVPPDTALLSFKLSIGKTAITSIHLCTNEAIMAFIPKEGIEVSSEFLYYYLSHYKWEGNRAAKGKTINKRIISDAIISLPPLSEQQSIVAELDKINEIIDLKKAQLKDLDLLAQSIFYDMFGDPIENQKGWEVKKLGDACSAQNGLVNPQEEPYNKMYHVGPANIVSNTGEIIELKTAEEENLKSGKYMFEPGMVLYSKIRPNLNKVALATFVGICSADMYPLICGDDIEPLFLLSTLNHQHFLKYAIENSGRANIPKINREALFAYNIMLPPLSLQKSFASKIQAIESQKSAIKQSLAEMETLLASRMDYYFN